MRTWPMPSDRMLRSFAATVLVLASACGGEGGGTTDGGGFDAEAPCASNADCDDGLFCNGEELCMPGSADADDRGCAPADASSLCADDERCDEGADECLPICDVDPDADGDGHGAQMCGGDDCDDGDPNRYPGNAEVCDAGDHDEDCDPLTYGFRDADGDGVADALCCNVDDEGTETCGDDCDDMNGTTNPSASEVCDGVDNDCDGETDEGVQRTFYPDTDGDGFGDGTAASVRACTPPDSMHVENDTDCDDGDPLVNPGAEEHCNGVDDDCDGDVDDGVCVPCPAGYTGVDGDCLDVNECAEADRCGRIPGGGSVNTCTNTPGSYFCTCGAGFEAAGTDFDATCADIDECADGTDDCDDDPADTCTNTPGSYTCACPAGYTGDARGPDGCLWEDPSLLSLTPDAGTLSPAFDPAVTTYTLSGVPGSLWSVVLTASVPEPGRTTLTVDGVPVASGSGHRLTLRPAPRPIDIVVTTESGATRTYTIVLPPGPVRYVKASNTGWGDGFGHSVALSDDGTVLAVGAYLEASAATGIDGDQASDAAENSGAVYVFRHDGASWAQEAYIKASNTGAFDSFGWSVALSGDGTVLAVGAPEEDSAATGIDGDQASDAAWNSGAVYVFRHDGAGWAQEAYLKASNTGAEDAFGSPVALSGDGTALAVGARGEASAATGIDGDQTSDAAGVSGAVYVFRHDGVGWAQEAYVKASNTGSGDFFGSLVALSGDGTALAVGALGEDSVATGIDGDETNDAATDSGAVYVFRHDVTGWTQEAYVKASNTGSGDFFGSSVALSGDGTVLGVGAEREDSVATGIDGDDTSNAASGSGAVYVY